jgi:hypothetical protein
MRVLTIIPSLNARSGFGSQPTVQLQTHVRIRAKATRIEQKEVKKRLRLKN